LAKAKIETCIIQGAIDMKYQQTLELFNMGLPRIKWLGGAGLAMPHQNDLGIDMNIELLIQVEKESS
jgi:hypothetical protein